MLADDPQTYQQFLGKFHSIRKVFRTPGIIQRATKAVVADAADDGVVYLELHFTPAALAQVSDFRLEDIFAWVLQAVQEETEARDIRVGLIASVNRHEPLELGEAVAQLAATSLEAGVVGLSLAGNEVEFPAEPFQRLFLDARENGLGTSVHAGEWAGPANVRYALEAMNASRIGHGVRILEDPGVAEMAKSRGTVFEVCLTSNVHSGVVEDIRSHPLPEMIQAGLRVTLNTDDPAISDIDLSAEYRSAVEELGLSFETLKGMILIAVEGAFLPAREKKALEAQLVGALFERR
jgi:adenosine deaminase